MKGCLKQTSRAPSPSTDHPTHPRKTVAFGADGSEQVFLADEWDRTPAEPSRNLSYQDILELKEIQRSLPHASQPADLISGRPASHYLSTVPIGLLPLLPETDAAPPPSSTAASSLTVTPSSWRTVRTPAPSIPAPHTPAWHPPHLSHLPPGRPPIHRQKTRFAFLPLLETHPSPSSPLECPASPPPSERSASPDFAPSDSDVSHDPPTPSLTNASLDSSPLSRASSCSPEPPFFQLPPSKHARGNEDFKNPFLPTYSDEQPPERWTNSTCQQPAAMFSNVNEQPSFKGSCSVVPIPSTPKLKAKKKNIIVVNDMEIELDGDDDGVDDRDDGDKESEESTPPAKPSSSMSAPVSSPPSRSPPSPVIPSSHAPICFKRAIPSNPPLSSPPRQGCPLFSNSYCGGKRNEGTSPPSTAGGCSSPVLVPSA